MEYNGKFGHNFSGIQHIAILIRIDICYTAWLLVTQTVSPTLPGFQGLIPPKLILAKLERNNDTKEYEEVMITVKAIERVDNGKGLYNEFYALQ